MAVFGLAETALKIVYDCGQWEDWHGPWEGGREGEINGTRRPALADLRYNVCRRGEGRRFSTAADAWRVPRCFCVVKRVNALQNTLRPGFLDRGGGDRDTRRIFTPVTQSWWYLGIPGEIGIDCN